MGVAEGAHFGGAHTGKRGRVEREHDPLALKLGQRHLALVGRGEGEVWCSVANGNHVTPTRAPELMLFGKDGLVDFGPYSE